MARQPFRPCKQRTRQHVIADQSVHHVEGFILAEGHTAQRLERDYGYDLLLFTYDEQGYVEPGLLLLQLKAAETMQAVGSDYVFDLDIRDYNLWMLEEIPVILIVFDATRKRASWLHVQRYFREEEARRPKKGAKTVRMRVPMRQAVNRRAIASMREIKREPLARVMRVIS
jgi:hypothetical protein